MDEQKRESLSAAKLLLASTRTGTLSVMDPESSGAYGALVNVAVDGQMAPLILISRLSRHTQGLMKNPAASVLLHGGLPASGDPLTALRATVSGIFHQTDDGAVRQAYLAHHPHAALYADFGDFSFWRMTVDKIHVVAGFGRVHSFEAGDLQGD